MVQWELIDYTGTVVAHGDATTIGPGAFGGAGAGGVGTRGWFYCHFIVQGINKNLYRAAIKLGDPNLNSSDIPALPAE
jgi:hypothetical protein